MPEGRAQQTDVAPRGTDALAANATFSTTFTFNRSMLESASQNMPEDLQPLVAKLRSITVHTFRYSAPGMYGVAQLDAVRAQYSGDGWTHWRAEKRAGAEGSSGAIGMQDNADASGMPEAGPADPLRTDVWVRMKHSNVDGVVLLVANQKNVNLVVVDGMIDPLELMHLRDILGFRGMRARIGAGTRGYGLPVTGQGLGIGSRVWSIAERGQQIAYSVQRGVGRGRVSVCRGKLVMAGAISPS